MVFGRIKEALEGSDEKYQFLLHKYSSLKLENKKLKEKNISKVEETSLEAGFKFAKELMSIYEEFEKAKDQSFKVHATSQELQKFLLDFNSVGKKLNKKMKENNIELYDAQERFYDIDLHDVSTYQEAKGMQKGIILKTTRKGCKYKSKIIKKPKVVVTK